MERRRFNTSANVSQYLQKETVDRAFQSLLEESMRFEGPIIQRNFFPNPDGDHLSTVRADLFTSMKSKTFDTSWRQELSRRVHPYSRNQTNVSKLSQPVNLSQRRNMSSTQTGSMNKMKKILPTYPELSSGSQDESVVPTSRPRHHPPPLPKEFTAVKNTKAVQKKADKDESEPSVFKRPNLRVRSKPEKNADTQSSSGTTSSQSQTVTEKKSVAKDKHVQPLAVNVSDVKPSKPTVPETVTSSSDGVESRRASLRKRKVVKDEKCTSDFEKPTLRSRVRPPEKAASQIPSSSAPKVEPVDKKPGRKKKSEPKVSSQAPPSQPPPPSKNSKTQAKKQYLDDWIAYMDENHNVLVKGHRSGCAPDKFWRSTPIVKRLENDILLTMSGTICMLRGPTLATAMLNKGYSKNVVKQFADGFPRQWKYALNVKSMDVVSAAPVVAAPVPVVAAPVAAPVPVVAAPVPAFVKPKLPKKRKEKIKILTMDSNVEMTDDTIGSDSRDIRTILSKPHLRRELESSSMAGSSDDDGESDNLIWTSLESNASGFVNLFERKDKQLITTPRRTAHKLPLQRSFINALEDTSTSSKEDLKSSKVPIVLTKFRKKKLKSREKDEIDLSSARGINKSRGINLLQKSIVKPRLTRRAKKIETEPSSNLSDSEPESRLPMQQRGKALEDSDSDLSSHEGNQSDTDSDWTYKKSTRLKDKTREKVIQPLKKTSKAGTGKKRTMTTTKRASKVVGKNVSPVKSPKQVVATKKATGMKNEKNPPVTTSEKNWSTSEVAKLLKAMSRFSRSDPDFWLKVARKVGRSPNECSSYYYEFGKKQKQQASSKDSTQKATNSTESQEGKKPSLDDDYEYDLFEDDDFKKSSKKLCLCPESKLEDIFGDLSARTPRVSDLGAQTPMSKFFLTPVSERQTPASSFSDLDVKIDWDNANRCVQKFRKNQKKGAGRLKKLKRTVVLGMDMPRKLQPQDLVAKLNKINEIPNKGGAKKGKDCEDDDSDQHSYFSDSDDS